MTASKPFAVAWNSKTPAAGAVNLKAASPPATGSPQGPWKWDSSSRATSTEKPSPSGYALRS